MNRKVKIIGFILLLLAGYSSIPPHGRAADQPEQAQKQPSAEEMQKIMDATFGAMVPMMAKMTEATIEAQLAEAAKPETATRLAIFKKNLYDALVKQGFSNQDAMQIVLNTSAPSAAPSTK